MARRGGSFQINHAGVAELLTSSPELTAFMAGKVEEVASAVRGQVEFTTDWGAARKPVEILSSTYTTDRAAGSVTLGHPAGIPLEAKYGFLAKAAQAAGFEWGRKSPSRGGA